MAKKSTIKPLPIVLAEDYVIVQRTRMDKTSGGIVLPDNDNPKNRQLVHGIVLSVGPGRTLDNGSRKDVFMRVGDEVFFSVQAQIELGEDLKSLLIDRGQNKDEVSKLALVGQSNVALVVTPPE